MKPQTILKVETELERVQCAINDLYAEIGKMETDPCMTYPKTEMIEKGEQTIEASMYLPRDVDSRYTAALKRASMDLTRALADLRQGR